MNNQKYVFFDLDDVLFLTGKFIDQNIMEHLRLKLVLDAVDRLMMNQLFIPKQDFITLREELASVDPATCREVDQRVWDIGLRGKSFIREVQPNIVLRDYIVNQLIPTGVNVGIATHRKSVDDDGSQTRMALLEHFPDIAFCHIYVMDKATQPNKVEFLQKRHGHFVLVDDNPIQCTEVLDTDSRLIIWDEHHAIPRYIHQRKADDINKLHGHINDLLFR